jgi:hypothetical protein
MNGTIGLLALALFMGVTRGGWPSNVQELRRVEARSILELPRDSDADSVFLQGPVGATRFDDGTIAVADGLAPAIRFFNKEGEFIASVGRAGEGPNEFSTPGWLGRCGENTGTVWDFSLMRFTTFDASGRILEQGRVQDRFRIPRPPALLSCSRNGRLAVLLRLGGERIRGRDISLLTSPLYLVRPGEEPLLLDGAAPVIEWIEAERTYRPVSMTTHLAASDSLIYVSRSDSSWVRAYDWDGRLASTWALNLPRRRPTAEHVRRSAEALTRFVSIRPARDQIIEEYMDMPRREYLPSHNGLFLDSADRLWVVLSFPGDPTTTLRAHALDGEALGEVSLPGTLDVLEIGADYVLGLVEDPDTLEPKVALYGFDLGG